MGTLGNFDEMFMFGSFMVMAIFVIVIGGIVFAIIKGISQWNSNNNQPVLTVNARIVNKRTNVSSHRRSGDAFHGDQHIHHLSSHTDTEYYVTFEVASGDRMEFSISGKESGLLAEGDVGQLTFQGTRYKGFQR